MIGVGQAGRLALAFDRNSDNAANAVFTALEDVKKAVSDVRLLEVCPDLVGLTDIAGLLEVSEVDRSQVRSFFERAGMLALWNEFAEEEPSS